MTRSAAKTFTFAEDGDGDYAVSVVAINRYGQRSEPFRYQFTVKPPKPPPPAAVWLQRGVISSGILSAAYLIVLFPLVWLYPRADWARTAVNSGVFDKFPLLHKHLLNSGWARRHLFQHLATCYADDPKLAIPAHYIPQFVYDTNAPEVRLVLVEDSPATLSQLLRQDQQPTRWRPRLMLLGRSGSGKSVLLRYLLQTTGKRFLDGTEPNLPLLIDLRTTPIAGQSVEALIRGALTGGGVELPPTVLDFLIHKGRFLLLIDSLNEVQDVTALKNILQTFLNQDAYNWVVMASQLDLLERSDLLRYRFQQVTPEQAQHYLHDVTGSDYWERLSPEAQKLAENPQDLALLGEILTRVSPEEMPTQRAGLYQALLHQDSALSQWVTADSGEIRAIYGLAFRMVHEGQRVLSDDDLVALIRVTFEELHIQSESVVATVMNAIKRSRMFRQEQEQHLPGLSRVVIGFQHELLGKYLAACYLLPFVGQSPESIPVDLITLSTESRWHDVFCFLLDRIESRPRLNAFLKDIRNQSPAWLQLVAYALKTKSRAFIDPDIQDAYLEAKATADVHGQLAA